MNINDLRESLFATLQDVKSGKMEIDRARAVSEVAQTIINTAKIEVDYIRATDARLESSFLCENKRPANQPAIPQRQSLADQISAAGRHN